MSCAQMCMVSRRTLVAVVGVGTLGSAGWMYRLIAESLLGLQLEVKPADPQALHAVADWPSFKIRYRLS